MSGTRFVVLLVGLALASVALVATGVPSWGEPDAAAAPAPATAVAPDEPTPAPGPGERTAEAVDPAVTTSADTAASWTYRRTAVADLDGDAVPERLVVASDVFVTDEGEPLWGDTHRWAVYVEEDDGDRTLVYSAHVPPGGVSAAASSRDGPGPRRIVIVEQGARRARLLLLVYEGAGRSRLVDAAGAELGNWADRVAEESE